MKSTGLSYRAQLVAIHRIRRPPPTARPALNTAQHERNIEMSPRTVPEGDTNQDPSSVGAFLNRNLRRFIQPQLVAVTWPNSQSRAQTAQKATVGTPALAPPRSALVHQRHYIPDRPTTAFELSWILNPERPTARITRYMHEQDPVARAARPSSAAVVVFPSSIACAVRLRLPRRAAHLRAFDGVPGVHDARY
ncbi:hypothetical protein NM688_g6550 [Phlebia brevispora]|uniref:Uncharacterized protein n=1 Tax=Phlebia brevispora TaxID=194682 RepID=A0ACC1SF54_9APHY|nr:hypothetical protein NM688_g6550 [Phlebia brevispora]